MKGRLVLSYFNAGHPRIKSRMVNEVSSEAKFTEDLKSSIGEAVIGGFMELLANNPATYRNLVLKLMRGKGWRAKSPVYDKHLEANMAELFETEFELKAKVSESSEG